MTSPNPASTYGKVQLTYDAKLNAILERTATQIEARIARLGSGIGGQVRKAQLNLVLNEIRNIQHAMWVAKIAPTIQRGRRDAARAAEEATQALDRVLYTALPEPVANAVRGGLRATAMAGIERDNARIPRELSRRVYHDFALTSGQVERTIRSGIIAGLSAREIARDVFHYISPTTPGGASYAAMRLARTEINNSFHEQQKAGGQRPGVKAVKWNLSGSHKVPDLCNVYASQNTDKLGAGLYAPGNVPDKPHPQCLCYLTYDTMSADEFAKALRGGKFDDELNARIKANLDRLGVKRIPPEAPAKPRKATTKVTPIKKTAPVKKATPVKKAAPVKKTTTAPAKKTTPTKKATPAKKTTFTPPHVPAVVTPTPAKVGPRTPILNKTPRLPDKGVRPRSAEIEFDILNVNPKYKRQPHYDINCVHVVNAYELRARGLQVAASKLPDPFVPLRGRSAQEALDRWRLPDGSPHNRSIHRLHTASQIKAEAQAWPDGARGWMRVSWKSGGGHIINVEKINGVVRFVDGQNQSFAIDFNKYLRNVKNTGWSIVRVDDLVPTDSVVEFIESAIR